ncbi:transporter substrate-binding domain-containing protein [Aquincola sp. S2]|uniref:histidine kinase n=1 Tax=Pseudaquabacterium terrae TaxID=2732868 RepID=A0ABX2EBK6_9BURK|nr:transporter substrate-binding domain-containing protein [Aquabacterium terrae]NRF66293.1 transporter substrate-binding domain-containing protein [Aquabacterium terrae]
MHTSGLLRRRWRMLGLAMVLVLTLAPAAQTAEDLLSPDERAWVNAHPTVRLATSSDYGPFTFIDGDGQVRGLSIDYVQRIEQLTGLRFERQPPAGFSFNLQRLGQGEIDVLMSLRDTPERRQTLGFSRPYVSVPAVLVRRREAGRALAPELQMGERVAVSKNYAVGPFLAERFPANPQVVMADDKLLLRALASGEVNAGVLDLAGATYLMRTQGIGNLQIAGDVGFAYDLGIGYRKDWPMLGRILDKALTRIDPAERQAMADRWFLANPDSGAFSRQLLWTIGVLLAAVLAGLLIVLAWNRSLRRLVAQRTAQLREELTERQRLQDADRARQTAEMANAAKSQFMAQVSHELRTPLNAVLGYAQLLAVDPGHPVDDTQRKRIGHIEDAARHLLLLIEDMMSFSRLEAGTLSLEIRPTVLGEVLARCLALAEPAAQAQSLKLRCELDELWRLRVMADPVRLEQVLHNLLSNAIKYNKPGGWVEVRGAAAPDGEVCVEVVDSGIGLTPTQQSQLFQPFNRLGRTDSQGTGIGLVICKQLIERMGGAIGVKSRAEHGSTFSLCLPAAGV